VRADAARNHERIVGAAVLAFEELGPEATLEEIAVRADLSVMTVYRRFRTRDNSSGLSSTTSSPPSSSP
jgi:AcrR family transcriptional regulator